MLQSFFLPAVAERLQSSCSSVGDIRITVCRQFGCDKVGSEDGEVNHVSARLAAAAAHNQNCSLGEQLVVVPVCSVLGVMSFCLVLEINV